MEISAKGIRKFFFILYLLLLHLALAYFVLERVAKRYVTEIPLNIENVTDPTEKAPIPTPIPIPSIYYDSDANSANANITREITTDPNALLIPVEGVKREQLVDSFSDARSEGRIHDAIDILAPQGTSVLAAADGQIVKFHDGERGGTAIYQLSSDRKYVLYYAHLQKRADSLKEGDPVRKGDVIGYVGDTGNASMGNFHLHFSIAVVNDPKRFWDGSNINPYPLLSSGSPLP